MNTETAIEIRDLRFSYGRQEVLKGVNLSAPSGSIFGFLGVNGAGKTTLIKILLGLLKADGGDCRVLGLDCGKDALEVRRRVGYMAEDQQMYGWMRVDEIIRWVGSFYKQWDNSLTSQLADMLELPRKSRVGALSKGQNSRLALMLALGHRPKVVILDDPTLGLDPIARKDFLRHVIELLQSNGVTVFFSSHLLYEIEPVADYVAILNKGVIIKSARTEQLRGTVKRFIFTPKKEFDLNPISGVLDAVRSEQSVSLAVEDADGTMKSRLAAMSANGVMELSLNLDEIFEAYVIGNRGTQIENEK
jgi:ABC-2 type transport system ATP-binding protein